MYTCIIYIHVQIYNITIHDLLFRKLSCGLAGVGHPAGIGNENHGRTGHQRQECSLSPSIYTWFIMFTILWETGRGHAQTYSLSPWRSEEVDCLR